MKRILIAAFVVCALLSAGCGSTAPSSSQNGGAGDDGQVARAFENETSNVQVEGEGVVTRILSDDVSGSRHQRFILSLASGQTILIVHNIDLAERVEGLQTGDSVRFYGEYVWNEQGGKVHWTHHDPQGRHVAGWLKHNGRTYQ
jgi:predicted small secreted protein